MNDPIERVTISIPRSLRDKAELAAKSERRSLSKQVQVAIERDLGLLRLPAPQTVKKAA